MSYSSVVSLTEGSVVFSIAENQAIKNSQARLEDKKLAGALHLARTRSYARSTQNPASNRHRKAYQVLVKVHLDWKNQHEDFIQKKTSVLATFYPRQARENLIVGKMIQEKGSKEAIVKSLFVAQAKTIRGFQGHEPGDLWSSEVADCAEIGSLSPSKHCWEWCLRRTDHLTEVRTQHAARSAARNVTKSV
jgi:hypothetical protein